MVDCQSSHRWDRYSYADSNRQGRGLWWCLAVERDSGFVFDVNLLLNRSSI